MRGTFKKMLFFSVCFALVLSVSMAKAEDETERDSESAILPISEDIEAAGELLIAPAIEPIQVIEEQVDEAAIQEIVNEDTDISAEDLGVSNPTILPGNPFYFAKSFWRGVRNATTFNPVKKAELKLKYANEKIVEAKILSEESGDTNRLEKAIDNYKDELDNIQERVDIIKEKGSEEGNEERLENFLDKFTDNQIKHQKIINTIAEKAPENIAAKVSEIKDNSMSQLANIPLQFEEPEQFRRRLEIKLEAQEGSTFKNFKNLEVLKEVEAKVPTQAKEAIQRAQENTFRRLENTMNTIGTEERNQFKHYVERIGGNEIRHVEIMHDFELREMPKEMRTEIEKAKEKAFMAVQERMDKFTTEDMKAKFIEHLDGGEIENIRIIKELENNLPPDTIEKIIEIKTKTMENFRKEIENSDNPDVQVNLMTKMQKFHDVKQFEMFKEMDQYIPEDKKDFWEQMKTKAQSEMENDFQGAKTKEERMRKMQALAGDSPEHIKILQGFGPSPEMFDAIMHEQMEKIDFKMNYIEDPERLRFMRENIESEELIQNEVRRYNPQIFQKMDMREDYFMKDMNKEEAERQIRKAIEIQNKLNNEVSGTTQDVKNIVAGKSDFQNNAMTIKDKLDFAQKALDEGNYRMAFELSTAVIHHANDNRQIMQGTAFHKEMENRDYMLIEQEKDQKREYLNQLEEKLDGVSGTEERQIRQQIQEHQQIIHKLEDNDTVNIGDKLRVIREEQRKEDFGVYDNWQKGDFKPQEPDDKLFACTMDWTPVCGKDGNTYSNLCVANNKGAQVDYHGECRKENQIPEFYFNPIEGAEKNYPEYEEKPIYDKEIIEPDSLIKTFAPIVEPISEPTRDYDDIKPIYDEPVYDNSVEIEIKPELDEPSTFIPEPIIYQEPTPVYDGTTTNIEPITVTEKEPIEKTTDKPADFIDIFMPFISWAL